MRQRNRFGHGFLVTLFGALLGLAACGAEDELDTSGLEELEPTPLDDAVPVESPEASESLGELDEVGEGLSTSATGRKVLFTFGKAAPDDSPTKKQLMRDSVAAVVRAYTSIAGESFTVHQSVDATVVSSAWVRAKLASFKTLGSQDTFVFYAHTHGTDAKMMAGPLPNGSPDPGISWSELTTALLAIPAKNVVVYMMSCHSGRLVEQFNAVRTQWSGRRANGRNLIVLSAVNGAEVAGASPHAGIGNPFTYAVAAATRSFVYRTPDRPYDGADGYNLDPQTWDANLRYSAKVSFGELGFYVRDITQWAADHAAYYAGSPVKHPLETGSFNPKGVFIAQPGIVLQPSRGALPATLTSAVQSKLASLVDSSGQREGTAPGAVVGIVAPGFKGIVAEGTKMVGTTARPDGNTFFQIGSVSKIFVGIALAHEVKRGALRLDDAAAAHLGGPLAATFSPYATLRSLITHTSGLRSMPENVGVFRDEDGDGAADSVWWAPGRHYERKHLVACLQVGKCKPAPDDGSMHAYSYSNLGIAFASLALEDHLGLASFDDLLKTRFVTPLGMSDTGTNVPTFITRVGTRGATGYSAASDPSHPNEAVPLADMGAMAGAGEILTTGNDMLKLLDQLAGVQTSSLTDAIVLAGQPLTTVSPEKRIGYAIESDVAEPAICSKPGSTAGFTAFVIWRRDLKLGVVVMVNRGGVHGVTDLGREVLELVASVAVR